MDSITLDRLVDAIRAGDLNADPHKGIYPLTTIYTALQEQLG